ncbi:1-acyl-sn-glycerol-3-phosphate acyltransferase [Candidatus Nomurabacteria bacterium]|nr:1-acyl-sn-glycerol-3-phosphate acyltransferase [Candidatus Nomurabacteria bacterium]
MKKKTHFILRGTALLLKILPDFTSRYLLHLLIFFYSQYLFKIKNKIEVIGKENLKLVKENKGILFVSNHETFLDSFLIEWAKISLWDIFFNQDKISYHAPDFRNFYNSGPGQKIMSLLKNIPIDRQSKDPEVIKEILNQYCNILSRNNLHIFFEGTRTRQDKEKSRIDSIGECKLGVVKMILTAKPKYIVPIFLYDIHPIMPIEVGHHYEKIRSGNKGKLFIGKPLDFSCVYASELTSKKEINALVKKLIRESVIKLAPQ